MNNNNTKLDATGKQAVRGLGRRGRRVLTQKPHWRVDVAEARRLFEAGIFNASTYLLAIIKSHGAAGWTWSFRVGDFCEKHGLAERSFYRALSNLRAKRLVFWEVGDKITVWWQESNLALVDTTSVEDCQEGKSSLPISNPDGSRVLPQVAETFSETLPQVAESCVQRASFNTISQKDCQGGDFDKIASNPYGCKAPPQVAETLPQVAETLPQVAETLPQVAETLPQVAETLPQVAEENAEPTQNKGFAESSILSSDFSSTPPPLSHPHPTTPPGEEELKLEEEEEEEGSEKGVVEGGKQKKTPRPIGRKHSQQKEGIAESQNSGGGDFSGAASTDDELQAKFLKWVIEVFLPTTRDYQEGKIGQLRPYALQTIANDTGALEREFLKALKAESEEAKYREMEVRMEEKALFWEATGHRITICRDYEDGIMGMPFVIIDQHTHVGGSDFLHLPIDSCTSTPPPPQGDLLLVVHKQRVERQTKIKSIDRWGRLSLGHLIVEQQWLADLLDAWCDPVLRASITQLVNKYPSLGLLIDGDRLIEEEF